MEIIKRDYQRHFYIVLLSIFALLLFVNFFRSSAYVSIILSSTFILFGSLILLLTLSKNIWIEKLALIFVGIGAAIFLSEIILLVGFGPGPVRGKFEGDYQDSAKQYRSMTEMGLRPNPGVYTSRRYSSKDVQIYDVKYTIDEDRSRNTPNFSYYEDMGQRGINFFGGSFTFGEGVNDHETLPAYVSSIMQAPVKNYAFHGYGAHQAYYMLRNYRLVDNNATDADFFAYRIAP